MLKQETICTSTHLHFCTSTHLHFCTSALLHICTLLHIYTSTHMHIYTYALLHMHICHTQGARYGHFFRKLIALLYRTVSLATLIRNGAIKRRHKFRRKRRYTAAHYYSGPLDLETYALPLRYLQEFLDQMLKTKF